MKSLSCVRLFVTLWTVAYQAPLSMGLSRQEYWSGLPYPPLSDLPDPGIEPTSHASPEWAGGFFTTDPAGKHYSLDHWFIIKGYDTTQEEPDEWEAEDKIHGKDLESHALWMCHSSHISTCSSTWKLSELHPFGGFIIGAWLIIIHPFGALHYTGRID